MAAKAAKKVTDEPRVVPNNDTIDFFARIRAIHRYHLLTGPPDELLRYLRNAFIRHQAWQVFSQVLGTFSYGLASISEEDLVRLYVTKRHWPTLVVKKLHDPLAPLLLDKIRAAGGRIVLTQAASLFPAIDPASMRGVVEQLIVHLALFEDLDPTTKDLHVGLLPTVLEDERLALIPRRRPPLEPCDSADRRRAGGRRRVPDLRLILLELAAAPARLRTQDGTFYKKDADRFSALLDHLPAVIVDFLEDRTTETRLNSALRWARHCGFVAEPRGATAQMILSAAGQKWLAASRRTAVRGCLHRFARAARGAACLRRLFLAGVRVSRLAHQRRIGEVKNFYERDRDRNAPERRAVLHEALLRTFRELPIGTFVPLDQFLDHAVFEKHNPLLLGRAMSEVTVMVSGRLVPKLEEHFESTGKQFFARDLGRPADPLRLRPAGTRPGRPLPDRPPAAVGGLLRRGPVGRGRA